MKSRITAEIDFDNNNRPVIQVHERDSDDTRDRLISHIFDQLGHHSRWFRVEFKNHTMTDGDQGALWHLIPITPEEYEQEIKLMQAHKMAMDTNTAIQPPKEGGSRVPYLIRDNSNGFRDFLDFRKYDWEPAEHNTVVYLSDPALLLNMGFLLAEYKSQNPK